MSAEPSVAGKVTRLRKRLVASLLIVTAVAAGTVVLAGGAWWLLHGNTEPAPAGELARALGLLDQRDNVEAWQSARQIALKLKGLDYRDPDFSGANEFILGIVAFRTAEKSAESLRDREYLQAVRYLRETESRALTADRKPEWCFALGSSLHQVGLATDALPLLEEAYQSYPAGNIAAGRRLIEILLDLKTHEALERALAVSSALLERPDLTAQQRDNTYMRRAWLLLALDRRQDAQEALDRISQVESKTEGTTLLHGQILMAEGKFDEARQLLKTVAEDHGLDQSFARQAGYLMGVCAEQMGNIDVAIADHRRTVKRYEETHEGVAANLRLGELLRREGWDEQALHAYRKVLSSVRRPADFRNRWLTLEKFRNTIESAWNGWVDAGKYEKAIELSRLMSPLFPEVRAFELAALASQRWAEQVQRELEAAPYSRRNALLRPSQDRWQASGKAFADLAEALSTSADYPDKLWISAEHYRNGHDFTSALVQLTRFINTQPKRLLPLAFVRRGRVLMDLDRQEEALDHFKRVLANYPADPAAFEAQYLVGKCYLERNQPGEAEKDWRAMLESEALAPSAAEWRLALLSLGRLYFNLADMRRSQADRDPAADMSQPSAETAALWDQAVRRLEEYLKRYPQTPEASEARCLVAKALQHSADIPRQKLETAETRNARTELIRAMNALLEQARDEFLQLFSELAALEEQDRLDSLGQKMLRDCYFELAHTYYALEDYERAIAAYSGAANRYPQDPQVLLAYVQMTNCYDRLDKPAEARGMLEQAKVILKQMPPEIFQPKSSQTNMTRTEWEEWLKRASELRRQPAGQQLAGR